MSDYGDDDILGAEGLSWFYVEEGYDPAEELAERAIASPPPFESIEEENDYDDFEYWVDIEYMSDGYNDVEPKPKRKRAEKASGAGKKRKIGGGNEGQNKKQKGGGGAIRPLKERSESPTPTVLWRPQGQSLENGARRMRSRSVSPFALLKDWKTLFKDSVGFAAQQPPTPPESAKHQQEGDAAEDAEGGWETDKSSGDEDADEQASPSADGLDPAVLEAILKERLGGNMDSAGQSMLLHAAMQMMSGEGEGTDDLIDNLTEKILDQSEESEEPTGISDWLAQQLPSHDEAQAEGGRAGKEAEEAPHSHSAEKDQNDQEEPNHKTAPSTDGNVDLSTDKSIPNLGRKRKAEGTPSETSKAPPQKRKVPSFQQPTAASQAKTTRKGTRSTSSKP
ncbi:hypothetical protein BDY21DRAFT_116091 [Lineolata rhizophorae]|uniref:Uncharacterized protein n=1 Tax=Lineolata rhizophorae TaxID=578093 RepID=A0A6A6NQE6_9PEZI|nr:hypothetical protein BDY21DRAFT_116091 [Lineolata rhizophorae]